MMEEKMAAPASVFQVVLNALELASKDAQGEFYLSDAAPGIDRETLYGYTGNPGLSGALQNLKIIEHAPVKGHFRFTSGYEFPNGLI